MALLLFATLLAGCETPERKRSLPMASLASIPSTVTASSRTADPKNAQDKSNSPFLVKVNGMTLTEAVGIAISRHPDISRANAVVTQSASEVSIARSAWYPSLTYGLQPGYGQSYAQSGRKLGGQASIGVNQLIYDFGKSSGNISAANATLAEKRYLLDDTVETVAFNAAATFVELAASQDLITAAQRQVSALKDIRTRINERVEAGLADTTDLSMADVAIQRAEAETLKARTRFDVAAGKLAELIGVRPSRIANLATIQSLIAGLGKSGADIEQTPAVLAANAALEASKADVQVAQASQWPSIGIGANRVESSVSNSVNDTTFVGVTIGGTYSLGGEARHKVAAAKAQRSAAVQSLENQRLVTRTALNSAQTEASGAADRLNSYQKVIALTRSSRDLFWQEYTLNKRPLTEVINSERDVYSAEGERIGAVADGVLAHIKAYASVGRLVSRLRNPAGVQP